MLYKGNQALKRSKRIHSNASTDVPTEKKVSSKKSRDVQVSKFGLGETSN